MISEEKVIVVPLDQAPWFIERNLSFDHLKHLHGNLVEWRQRRLTTQRNHSSYGPKVYDRDTIIDFVCCSLELIEKVGLQPKSPEGQQIIANVVHGIHGYNHFIGHVFKTNVDPFYHYE